VEGVQSKVKHLQDAMTRMESWAERMSSAYREFKAAVCEVFKLVNSRQHILGLLNTAIPSSQPSGEFLGPFPSSKA
jgi:hypothetical protein